MRGHAGGRSGVVAYPTSREFAPRYEERVGKPFDCNMRADFITPETATILRDMGCKVVRFGVESGDEHMTSEVLSRGLTVDRIRKGFTVLRDVGVDRWSYNMLGLPGETLPMALKTVHLNAELDPELAIPFLFYPYPGTRRYDVCRTKGLLTQRESISFSWA